MPRTLAHKACRWRVVTATLLALAGPSNSLAQSPGTAEPAVYAAAVAPLPEARDSAWPDTVVLAVDATDLDHRVLPWGNRTVVFD